MAIVLFIILFQYPCKGKVVHVLN